MSTKTTVKQRPTRSVQLKNPQSTKTQKSPQLMDLKQSLKLLEDGNAHLIDFDLIGEEFLVKPHLGDVIQYELYKYCQKNADKAEPWIVVKLASLCYSHLSVSQFTKMERFVGCVYYISSYLLKKDNHKAALDVIYSLELKKTEILEASKEKSDIRNFLCNIHSSFIASAVGLASKLQSKFDKNYEICQELAKESLKCLLFTNSPQLELGKKVLKTSKLYLQTIKHYKEEDISLFYSFLKIVLKSLLPVSFCEGDYFLFYLHRMDLMKNVDYNNGCEVYEVLKKTLNFLGLFLKIPSKVKSNLDEILNCFFKIESGVTMREDLFNDFLTNDSHCELYFVLVSVVFSHGIQFWWNSVSDWSENVSREVVERLCRKIFEMHEFHSGSSILYCTSGCPYGTCFGDLLTGNLLKIQYTVRLCLKRKVPNALSLVPIARKAFRLAMDSLEKTKTKPCCREQRIYSWKHSVIHHTNTVEDILRLPSSNEGWCHMRECSREILREIFTSEVEAPYDAKRTYILFQRWHHANLKLENFTDALLVCVLYHAFYPQEEPEIISMWLQTKSESSNEIIQEMTVSDVVKTCGAGVKEFWKDCPPSLETKPLLMMELKAYSGCPSDTFQNPKTCYALASRIWKQLEKRKLDMWETSLAVTCLIAANASGEDDGLPENLQEKCKSLIADLMSWKRKGRAQCRSLFHAGNLRLSLFLCEVKSAEGSEGKTGTSEMVLKYLKKEEEEKVKFGEDVDLNLTCNVIPSSSHLTVELETRYLEKLDEVLDLWGRALGSGSEDVPNAAEFDTWLRNLEQVARMYELFGEYQSSLRTWFLAYRIGKMCEDSGAVLLGLSQVVKSVSDVEESPLLEEGELLVEKLRAEGREKASLAEYSLAVAGTCLRGKKVEKCLEYLGRAKGALEGFGSGVKAYALAARLWCLVSQLVSVHPEADVVFGFPSGVDVRVTAFKAFGYVSAGGRSELLSSATQSECTELVLAMLEVNTWAYHLHGTYRQTDFMRFFLDDLYQIVQKLFLPTRTAEMLVRLAEVDLLCEKIPDCQGKVTKLKSILTTLASRCEKRVESEKSPMSYLSVPGECEVPSPRPISPARFLEKPAATRDSDLSPIRYHLDDVKPKSSEHVKKCRCRLCQNILVQTLTMETLRVEADMFLLEKSPKKSAACYGLAHDAMKKLTQSRAEQGEVLRMEAAAALRADPGPLDFQLNDVQFHSARFLIRYALFEASTLKTVTENVTKTMVKISKLMKKFTYEEKVLQWTFMELKLLCVVLSKDAARQEPKKSTPVQYTTRTAMKTPSVARSSQAVPPVTVKKKATATATAASPCHQPGKKIGFEDTRPKTPLVFRSPQAPSATVKKVVTSPRKRGKKIDFESAKPKSPRKKKPLKNLS